MYSWVIESKKYFSNLSDKVKYDVCIANFAIPGGIVAQFLKKKYNIPFVIISHGHDIPWFFPKQMFFYHLLFYNKIKNICNDCAFLLVQSEQMKQNAERFLSDNKINKIPNGCDIDSFYHDYNKKSKVFKIIFCGRLVKQKNPMLFLKSIYLYNKINKNIIVEIIGDGPYRSKMEKYIKNNNLNNIVNFSGWISKEELLREYQSASILLSTSYDEGMSMTIMEALSSGLYILATPVSENLKLINKGINGEIINSKPELIADEINKFYIEKFLNNYNIPIQEIENIKNHYNWDNIVGEYEKVLLKLTNCSLKS